MVDKAKARAAGISSRYKRPTGVLGKYVKGQDERLAYTPMARSDYESKKSRKVRADVGEGLAYAVPMGAAARGAWRGLKRGHRYITEEWVHGFTGHRGTRILEGRIRKGIQQKGYQGKGIILKMPQESKFHIKQRQKKIKDPFDHDKKYKTWGDYAAAKGAWGYKPGDADRLSGRTSLKK